VSGRPRLGAHAALRWPLAPLLELARLSPTRFARRYGISGATMRRAGAEGLDRQADQWATRLGYHPADVWGQGWLAAGSTPDVAPGQGPAPTRRRGAAGRSTGHTAPRTPVPRPCSAKAVA
jgi:hypothetical protein